MRVPAVAVALLFLVPAASFAGAGSQPACKPGVVFQDQDVRVWFHATKAYVKVFDTNGSDDEGATHFDYATSQIAEIDGNNTTVAWMDLQRAFPQSSGCTITDDGQFVNMTIGIMDSVHTHGEPVGPAVVQFAYHFNKTSHGAKFDLNVISWPWRSTDGHLAFAFDVHAANGTLEPASNGIGYRDANGTARGSVQWASNATATYADRHQETARVDANTTLDGSSDARVTLAFDNVTAGYTRLEYDPFAGVGPYVVVGGTLIDLAPVEDALPAGTASKLATLL